MKKITRLSFLLLLLCGSTLVQAQRYNLTGTLLADDTSEPLEAATIMILNPKDSSLINFGRSEANGIFNIRGLNAKDGYLLRITFLSYQMYDQQIPANVAENPYSVGTIRMLPESLLLNEAIVKAEHIPVQIKKDTIEFNALAFKTQENADVETLLKQLPGVEVDSDGTIRAQGEQVRRVLVDGKEFFGTDPTIATKNLPAKAIDKIQVFDRKSDQAIFSGIDDGVREKTLNLTTKKDFKKGLFGTVNAGYGDDERFDGRINVNRFREDQQLSLIGMGNNVNKQGFSVRDYMSFTGAARNMARGGAVQLSFNSNNPSGVPLDFGNNNTGFTRTWAGGLNFNNEWNQKTKANGSYFFNSSNKEVERNLSREDFLANGSFTTFDNSFGINLNESHRANFTLEHDIDSSSNIKFITNGGYSTTNQNSESFSESLTDENLPRNSIDRFNLSTGQGINWSNELLYRLRFNKRGRTFSTNLTFGLNENERNSQLESANRFFRDGTPLRTDSIMQISTQFSNRVSFGGTASYTEPLGKRRYLEMNYTFNQTNTDQDFEVFDINNGERQLNDQLTAKFDNATQYHRGGLNFRKNNASYNFTAGVQLQQTILDGKLLLQDVQINRSFTNLLPSVRFNYDFTSAKSLRLEYATNVNEPSIEQLSPLVDNSNPFNISLGNPNLRPEYAHRFVMGFNTFNPGTFINFFSNISFTYTQNRISNAQQIDENFVRITQPINVDDDYRLSSFLNFGFPIKRPSLRASLSSDLTWIRSVNLINALENQTERLIARSGARLNYRHKELINASLNANISYNQAQYSLQKALNQDFINQNYEADFNLNLTNGFSIGSSFNYAIYNSINGDGLNQEVPIWNASLSKFLLNRRGELRLSVNDLLNRNVGINRIADINFVQEEVIRSLGRYFMLGFTYSLQQLGAAGGGGPMIRMLR
ncbi:MAG TPA: TonB-dependent receptor [Saprospiraceae bacterium]|nr:TonB-dependent receptor [Saprospiraceae bacterium]HMP24918.1 TonB-dependent receptor [Saprospiraceae bacterium]